MTAHDEAVELLQRKLAERTETWWLETTDPIKVTVTYGPLPEATTGYAIMWFYPDTVLGLAEDLDTILDDMVRFASRHVTLPTNW